MTDYLTAINAIATFPAAISPLKNAFTLSATPMKIGRELCPALVTIPVIDGEGQFISRTYQGQMPYIEFEVTQLLLWVDATKDYNAFVGPIHQWLQDYFTALQAQPFYGAPTAPPVHSPAQVSFKFDQIEFAGVEYLGVVLHHKNLRINL